MGEHEVRAGPADASRGPRSASGKASPNRTTSALQRDACACTCVRRTGVGQRNERELADDVERRRGVVRGRSLPRGRDHRDRLGGQRPAQRVQGPLDPAHLGREGVRDDQRPGDVHGLDILPERDDQGPTYPSRHSSTRSSEAPPSRSPRLATIAVDGTDARTMAPRSRDRRRRRPAGRADADARSCSRRPVGSGPTSTSRARATDSCCSRTPSSRPSTNCSAPTCCPPTSSSPTGATSWSWWPSSAAERPRTAPTPRASSSPLGARRRPRPGVPRGDPSERPSTAPRRRGRRGRPRRPGGLEDPPWDAADGRGFRPRRPPRRGRSRVRDRLHEGMLPRPGVRGEGPEPRAPTSGPPRRPIRRAPPSRSPRPRRRAPVGEITSAATDDGREAGIAPGALGGSLPRSLHGGGAALPTVER